VKLSWRASKILSFDEAIVASFEDLSFLMESSWQTPEVVKPSCGRLQKVCFEAGESDLLAVL
jgi:hypothetical protein